MLPEAKQASISTHQVLQCKKLTYDEHFLGLNEGVKGCVDDDLAAVGAAVDEVNVAQLEGPPGRIA